MHNRNPHLTTTSVATNRLALKVLEDFVVDQTLPKHASQGGLVSTGWATLSVVGANSIPWGSNETRVASPGLWSRLWAALWNRAKERHAQWTAIPVEETFEAIFGAGKKLQVLTDRLEAHQDAIKEARAMGQTALAEQLEQRTHVVQMEAVLFAAGYREYIEEEQLITFAQQCEKGLRLDLVRNFTRLIPQDVRVRKLKLDALKVFDQWAVLHYDPDSKGAALTAAEIAKKKDPILFGLIKGSRRLYHGGSWKDEYCDLTFPDLIDRYGKEALTLK